MFDVGFTELMLIGVVALVVIGPERLPDVARTLGRWISKMQRFVRGVKSDINAELETGDLKKLIGDQKEQISELRNMVNTTRKEIETSTRNVVGNARKRLDEMEDSVKEGGESTPADAGSGIPAQKRSASPSQSTAVIADSPEDAANSVDTSAKPEAGSDAGTAPKAGDSSSAAGQGG